MREEIPLETQVNYKIYKPPKHKTHGKTLIVRKAEKGKGEKQLKKPLLRPGLKACLDFLNEGDILIVWRLDRLGRSLSQLIETIRGLKTRGIGFRSLNETIDTTNATGELLFHIFGALAQYERALIRECVIAGLRAAERRGRRGGRPRALDQEKIEAARDLLAGGRSMSVAARTLGVPRSTLVDALKRGRS